MDIIQRQMRRRLLLNRYYLYDVFQLTACLYHFKLSRYLVMGRIEAAAKYQMANLTCVEPAFSSIVVELAELEEVPYQLAMILFLAYIFFKLEIGGDFANGAAPYVMMGIIVFSFFLSFVTTIKLILKSQGLRFIFKYIFGVGTLLCFDFPDCFFDVVFLVTGLFISLFVDIAVHSYAGEVTWTWIQRVNETFVVEINDNERR